MWNTGTLYKGEFEEFGEVNEIANLSLSLKHFQKH
jgi:hypothetical protein